MSLVHGGAATIAMLASISIADLPSYSQVGSYPLVGSLHDVMPDGRLLSMAGPDLYMQDTINGSTWTRVGSIDAGLIGSFGASFVSMSPDGSWIAIGDNQAGVASQEVHFVETSALQGGVVPVTSVASENWDAVWNGPSEVYVAGSLDDFSAAIVRRIDLNTWTSSTVVEGINGAPGGIALLDQHLYVGNGFDGAGIDTGLVRAAPLSDLPSLYGDMVAVADDLSASPLSFDVLGNLLIGGGDLFGGTEFGYAAVVDGDEVAGALAGGAIASSTVELDPNPGESFYGVDSNPTTGEVLVSSGGTMYRYAIPAPASLAVLMPTVLWRRRARGA